MANQDNYILLKQFLFLLDYSISQMAKTIVESFFTHVSSKQ